MELPFPGMDPYLEHPILWEGFHARLIPIIANQIQPRLEPRYVTSIEERVFVEGPQRGKPEVWIEKVVDQNEGNIALDPEADVGIILQIDDLEVHQGRVEVLDLYEDMKLVTVIEAVSPTNKVAGPGRKSYQQKQRELLERDCHFVEIDLLRRGRHVVSIPKWRTLELRPFDYLTCVSRWPKRHQFKVYPARLRERLPRIKIPLAEPDPDVTLDLQAAVEQALWEGRYLRRVRYHEP